MAGATIKKNATIYCAVQLRKALLEDKEEL